MVKPRTAPSSHERMDCDVCIVGAGAAGISLALDLVGCGEKVILVDGGALNGKQTDQSLYEGHVANDDHALPHLYRHRRLGGSTAIWGGRCVPYDPVDFAARDFVAMSGWPFGAAELDPYYARAQKILHAGAFDYDVESAIGSGELIEGFQDSAVLTDRLERYSLPTNVWREHRRRISESPNVQVVADSTALRFIRGDGAHIEELACISRQSQPFSIRARAFVAAVGGLETVRLLGFSGIGNDADMLGRTYMCHVEGRLGQLRVTPKDRPVIYGFERTLDGVYARRRITLSTERQQALRVMNAAVRPHHPDVGDPSHGHPVLSAMFLVKRFIIPEYAKRFASAEAAAGAPLRRQTAIWAAHVGNVLRGAPTLAAFSVDWTRRRYLAKRRLPYVSLPSAAGEYPLDFNGEQEPNLCSRVRLAEQTDRHGVPKLLVDWRLTDLDYRTVSTTLREIRSAFRRAGCGDVEFDDAGLEDEVRSSVKPVGGHHIGTARMSTAPKLGVVDSDCQVHGTANLYVAGSAVFPTSSQANPTLTIVALALRLGEHLRSRLAGGSHVL